MRDRFDKFTDDTRTVLRIAEQEARKRNEEHIKPEHILLGLLLIDDVVIPGASARMVATHLRNAGMRAQDLRGHRHPEIRESEDQPTTVPLDLRTKWLIVEAIDEARRMGQRHVGPEHLLLGLIREGGAPAQMLNSRGITLDYVRALAARLHPGSRSEGSIIERLDDAFDNLFLADVEKPKIANPEKEAEEPDESALAGTADVVEAQADNWDKAIDRTLNMEGISVDDPVRIYLREIGRTAFLKSPDESALAEKMAAGRAAEARLSWLEGQKKRSLLIRARRQGSPKRRVQARARWARAKWRPVTQAEYEEMERTCKIHITEGSNAKQQLVQANLRLVVSIARRYIGRGLSLLDLIQEGNIGLMKAADKFDPSMGVTFSAYATWWIRQAITRALLDQSRMIRLPMHVTEMVTRLRRAAHDLQQKLLREPTEEELGHELGMSAEKVRKILDIARYPAALDAPTEEGEDSFLGDFTSEPGEQMGDILGRLTEREQQILKMRYGLTDGRPHTLAEVARALGITRERIRQIETRILRKLRRDRFSTADLSGYPDYAWRGEMVQRLWAMFVAAQTKGTEETKDKEKAMQNTGGSSAIAIEQLRTLFEHSFWARDRLLGVVQTLDDAGLRDVPESGAYGSVFDTLVHMAVSEWMWVQRCTGESPLRLPKGEDFANLRVLVEWWNEIHATSMEFLDKVTPAGLEEQVTYMGPDGKTRTRKVWHMLLQVPNHQTEHRAQLGTLLGQRGVELPPMDLVVFLSERNA